MTESNSGGPPPQVIAVAVLCGLLSIPMLATAGSLAAFAVSDRGLISFLSALFAIGVLAIAGVNLVGALHVVERGRARLAQLGGYLTIGVTALLLVGLLAWSASGAAFAMPLIFLPTAIAMLTLLGTRRTRLWLTARSRAFEPIRLPARQSR